MNKQGIITNQPTYSMESEEALLGAAILNSKVLIDVINVVKPTEFYRTQNQIIYEHILGLWENGDPVDVLTVQESLKNAKVLEKVGGPVYVDQLFDRVPSSDNAPHYAKIVHDMAMRRKIADLGRDLVTLSSTSELEASQMLNEAGKQFVKLAVTEVHDGSRELEPIVDDVKDDIERGRRDGFMGLRTGYGDIDGMLSGLQKSDFIILAARPSVGKTSLAMNIAENAAKDGKKILFFSLEMSDKQLGLRLLASMSGYSTTDIRNGKISNKQLQPFIDELTALPITINDDAAASPLKISAEARRMAMRGGLDLIIVDYLQLIVPSSSRKNDNRVVEVSDISRSIKQIGRELDVPVLALSQLSRASEQQMRQPRLSDLRESGALEQDADVVMFLHREEVDPRIQLDDDKDDIKLVVAKHRNGPIGSIRMKFDRVRTKFQGVE